MQIEKNVTAIMDKWFIRVGFQKVELEESDIRGFLYMGMIFMVGQSLAFLIMAILS